MPSVRYSGSGAGQDLKGKHRRHCSLQQRHTSSRTSQISHRSKKENKDILLHETKERFVLNTQMLVQQITEAKMRGEDTGMLAYRFHQVLAEMITAACIKAKESSGRDKVAFKRWRIPKPVTAASDRRTTVTGRIRSAAAPYDSAE